MAELLIFCLPALGWGLMPVIAGKVGGKPVEQLLGTTLAALGLSVVITLMFPINFTAPLVAVSLLSGSFWALGQYLQFVALSGQAVSRVMPISNGTQLLFTSLCSGILLREWRTAQEAIVTLIILSVIILSIALFSYSEEGSGGGTIPFSTLLLLFGSSLSLTGYVSVTKLFQVSGLGIFLPQSIGMLLAALLIFKLTREKKNVANVWKSTSVGLSWSIANVAIFYTAGILGVGLSYVISQLCVFVSIIGGIVFLGEKKTRKEWRYMSIAVVLFLFSIGVLSLFK